MDIKAIQEALRASHVDGWLLCDFRNREFLANRVLGLNLDKLNSRRWYYFIPSKGTPKKLVHSVERQVLDGLPGTKKEYVSWKELHAALADSRGEEDDRDAVLAPEPRPLRVDRGRRVLWRTTSWSARTIRRGRSCDCRLCARPWH